MDVSVQNLWVWTHRTHGYWCTELMDLYLQNPWVWVYRTHGFIPSEPMGMGVQNSWVYTHRTHEYGCTELMGLYPQNPWVWVYRTHGFIPIEPMGMGVQNSWVYTHRTHGYGCRKPMVVSVQNSWAWLYRTCGCVCVTGTQPIKGVCMHQYIFSTVSKVTIDSLYGYWLFITQAVGCQDGTIACYQLIFSTVHGLYKGSLRLQGQHDWRHHTASHHRPERYNFAIRLIITFQYFAHCLPQNDECSAPLKIIFST